MDGSAGEAGAEHRALLSLAIAAHEQSDQISAAFAESFGFQTMEPGESLRTLAALRAQQATILPMIIRPLSRLAVGRPELVQELETDLRELHIAVAREVNVPEEKIEAIATQLHQELVQLSLNPKAMVVKAPSIKDIRDGVGGDDDDIRPVFDRERIKVLPDKEILKAPVFKEMSDTPVIRTKIQPIQGDAVVRQANLAYTNAPPPPPPSPPAEASPIEEYQKTTAEVLGVDHDEVTSPPCDDRTKVENSVAGYIVEIEWWTTTPIVKFRPWLKPSNWPSCNKKVFFKGMKKVNYTAGTQNAWNGDYVETVEIVPGNPIETGLSFAHYELRSGANNNSGPVTAMWTEYDLTSPGDPNNQLLLDHGSLVAQRTPAGPNNEMMTYIKLSKTYEFKDPAYRLWPTLACDTFFGEISMLMASNCGKGFT